MLFYHIKTCMGNTTYKLQDNGKRAQKGRYEVGVWADLWEGK